MCGEVLCIPHENREHTIHTRKNVKSVTVILLIMAFGRKRIDHVIKSMPEQISAFRLMLVLACIGGKCEIC